MRRYEELISAIEKYDSDSKERHDRCEAKLDKVCGDIVDLKVDLATHKIKSGFWGAAMAALVSFIGWLIK